jgi:tRNA (adenine22-N1)-methyltransferase
MKTGIRLTKIDKMITQPYQEIWDCCCDHGLLGLTLLKRQAADVVHFVDVVEPLMLKLDNTLQRFFSDDVYQHRWQVHCLDVAKLPLTLAPKKLIIIAGVGGELLIELMTAIVNEYQAVKNRSHVDGSIGEYNSGADGLEFIICPVHHHYKVRQALIKLNAQLIDECLVTENKRFYEIIHVSIPIYSSGIGVNSNNNVKAVSAVGSLMWDLNQTMHQQYLAKTIKHYQRMLNNAEMDVTEIVAAYQDLTN